MPQFMVAYHGGGAPKSEEDGKDLIAKMHAWMKDCGDTLADPGNPVGKSKTVSASGVEDHGGASPLMAFSVMQADNIDAVVELAQKCPHLKMPGASIEIAEIMDLPPPPE
ncbi:MAG: YciI family protein [Rhodospirillales bacterium]